MRTKFIITAVLVASSFMNLNAQNDTTAKKITKLSLEELMNIEVVTASKFEEKIWDAPVTIIVITQEEIEKRGYKDLKDIFRDLPGFDISENVGGEIRTLVTAHGILGNNKMMILRDGKKINSPAGDRFVYGNNLPLFNVKRIEIIYGPASAMYGADAYSGVVNMITKDVGNPEGLGELQVSYGRYNTSDVSGMIAKELSEDLSFMFSSRFYNSDGIDVMDNFSKEEIFQNPQFYDQANPQGWEQPIKDYDIYSKIHFKNLTLGLYRMDAKEPNGPSTDCSWFSDTTNPQFYVYDKNYVWHQIMDKVYFDHKFEKDKYSITSSLEYSDYIITNESGWFYSWGPQYKFAKSTSIKLDEQLNYKINDKTNLVSGIIMEQVSAFPKTNNLSAKFHDKELYDFVEYPDDPGLPEEYRNKKIYFGVFDYQNYNVFTEIKKDITKNIHFNLGARYDYNTDYFGVFNPRAGLVSSIGKKTRIKLLYGSAYIQPSKYNSYEHWSAGGFFGYYPNPELKPEKLNSLSLNVNQMIADNFSIALNTYFNKIENLITPDGGWPWARNINRGSQDIKGLELNLNYVSKSIRAYLYYSYLDARRDDGSQMNKVAKNKINGGIIYSLGKFSFSPRIRWSDVITGVDGSTFNGHTVVDLTIRGEKLFKGLSIYLTVINLLNEKYYTASPFEESGWLMPKAPQPGITGELGITYKF